MDSIAHTDPALDRAGKVIAETRGRGAPRPAVRAFFDEATFTASYVVHDPVTRKAAIIDSVLDYDPSAGRTSQQSADAIVAYVEAEGLQVEWLLETHAHADHLSAAPYLQQRLGGQLAIGRDIVTVQTVFGKLFNEGTEFQRDGSQFDRLFDDGDRFTGRRPRSGGAARPRPHAGRPRLCDRRCRLLRRHHLHARISEPRAPTSRAATRIASIARSADFSACRARRGCSCAMTTRRQDVTHSRGKPRSARSKTAIFMFMTGSTRTAFVAMRNARDRTLDMPKLILPAVQVNMRGGQLPAPEDNGTRYLKIPLDAI